MYHSLWPRMLVPPFRSAKKPFAPPNFKQLDSARNHGLVLDPFAVSMAKWPAQQVTCDVECWNAWKSHWIMSIPNILARIPPLSYPVIINLFRFLKLLNLPNHNLSWFRAIAHSISFNDQGWSASSFPLASLAKLRAVCPTSS